MTEIEVYRLTPQAGKAYKTAEWTRKENVWPNDKYFTKNTPIYVGKFIEIVREGEWGDGARIWSLFDDNGKINRVEYTYEGTTSFIEVSDST